MPAADRAGLVPALAVSTRSKADRHSLLASPVTYQAGDRVEYIAAPVFDLIIQTGDVGVVTKVEDGWVFADWLKAGIHSVPAPHVRGFDGY